MYGIDNGLWVGFRDSAIEVLRSELTTAAGAIKELEENAAGVAKELEEERAQAAALATELEDLHAHLVTLESDTSSSIRERCAYRYDPSHTHLMDVGLHNSWMWVLRGGYTLHHKTCSLAVGCAASEHADACTLESQP